MPVTRPRRFVVAPSGFKECLDAHDVAAAIAAGIRRVVPGAVIDLVPLVDGGEGSAAAMAAATGGRLVPARVTGPVGRPVDAHVGLLGGPGPLTAVVEMAQAAGLYRVPADTRDPGVTTTYGVGELITAALDLGATRLLVGCGDSGTSDGGAGALQALGADVRDSLGNAVGPGGSALAEVDGVDLSGLDPRLDDVEILAAVNPHNVLCGPNGVARVFGPQKGATPEQVDELDGALERWAKVLSRDTGLDVGRLPGSGASGGLGAGLAAGLGARLRPRFDVLLDHVDLDGALAAADLVVTAEGALDAQTPRGKVPAEVARRARRHHVPTIALAGTLGAGVETVHEAGIDAYATIVPAPIGLPESVSRAAELLTDATERALRMVLVGTLCAARAA
ncbi:glycerate kinase [Pseudonocardia sp. C8]|uniref:glycerate kinase family protein n=1 Tax=Pseudonocardia sp. C8 TaxID=2762759 RepID=UPI00164235A1|nr:glycerate kinase [Pseudonocardia sp. C8]MBC3193859.1 glycerate kinase [Pseudonocardia sp. C8]